MTVTISPSEQQPTETVCSPMETLLRETMAEFWRQNNLGQKYDVIRRALETARQMT